MEIHLISIIIPFFNTEQYIERCVNSVINQTYAHLEIILVNDGSTDQSLVIAEKLQKKDKRICIINQENSGASIARNRGIDASNGDYIMFVDSDDWIDENMVESLYNDITSHDADITISSVPYDKDLKIDNCTLNGTDALGYLIDGAWWGVYGKLYSLKAIGTNRFPTPTICEDYAFLAHLFASCDKISFLNQCFYHRETRENSLSHLKLSTRKFDEYTNVESVVRFIKVNHPQYIKQAEARLAESSLKLLFEIYKNNKEKVFANQRKMLLKSIRKRLYNYLTNKHILFKSRIILAFCFSNISSKIAFKLYSITFLRTIK